MMESTTLHNSTPGPAANTPPPKSDWSKWLWYAGLSVGLIVLTWALLRRADIDWGAWWALATDQEALKEFIEDAGVYAPLVCIAMNFIQVVIFFIPGEVTQIVSGLAFGTVWGFIYSFIGLVLGSMFNFYIARRLGRPFVEK